MIRLDNISCSIVKTILVSSGITINYLCQQLAISRRNFYYRLEKINDWLQEHGFDVINNDRLNGLHINDQQKQAILDKLSTIDSIDYELNSDERVIQILILLVISNTPIFVDDINRINRVSRNTTLADIKIINQTYENLIHFKTKQGYFFNIDLLQQRLFIFQIIQSHLKYNTNFIDQLIIKQFNLRGINNHSVIEASIEKNIANAEGYLKRKFTDKDRRLLRYMLFICVLHHINRKAILPFNLQQQLYLKNQPEWLAANSIQQYFLHQLDYDLAESEVLFISLLLSVLKIHHFDKDYIYNDTRLVACIRLLIAEFQRLAGVIFTDKLLLEKQLVTHLKSAIQRALFGIHIHNLLREEIKHDYPQVLNIITRSIVVIENEYQFKFNDDELCYIVMIFVAWLNKPQTVEEKKVLLVTDGGMSSTMMLKQQLRKLTTIPLFIKIESISEYYQNQVDNDIELIITTADISNKPPQIPMIKVKHILDHHELLQIRHVLEDRDYISQVPIVVNALINQVQSYIPDDKRNTIQDKFDLLVRQHIAHVGLPINSVLSLEKSLADNISISRKKLNWFQALEQVSHILIDKGIISLDYLDEIKDNIERFGMYMYLTPQIALLHGSPLSNLRMPHMALMKVTKPITFSIGKQPASASLIFFLVPEATNSHIKLLEQLNNILSDNQQMQRLLNATNVTEIKTILFE